MLSRSKIDETSAPFHTLLDWLPTGNKFLDVGCGDGSFAALAKEKFKEVYGIDISEIAIEKAKARGVDVKKVDLNVEQLPYPNEHFDTVVCLEVIEHILDPDILLKEIHRVLVKDGCLLLSTPNIQYWRRILTLLRGHFPKTSDCTEIYGGGHVHFFTYTDLENLLVKNGFRIVKKSGNPPVRFLMNFICSGILIKAQKPSGDR